MTHRILSLIEAIDAAKANLRGDARRFARVCQLQRWQVHRLAATYADYQEQPRYQDAIRFFTQELYGPLDYTERNNDLQRVIAPWQRILPERALTAVAAALELELLSLTLDAAVADVLPDGNISGRSYATAYRVVGRRNDRARQIAMIIECGRALEALIANPWIKRALRIAAVPARLGNLTALHRFLMRGYSAFEKMQGAKELLRIIEERETAIMNRLFANHSDPFSIDPTQAQKTAAAN